MHARELRWDGCLNVRDLGGHPTRDGRETCFGAVVRADSLFQLTAEGWRALVAYGIRTIVDLREDQERSDDAPRDGQVELVHAPFRESDEKSARIEREFADLDDRADVYRVFLRHFAGGVAVSLRAVASAAPGGVAVHCVGGKDRTGLLAAFMLHLAGVDHEAIAADYAVSEERLRPREAEWLAEAQTEEERDIIRRRSRTPAEAMLRVFADLEREYGSVEGYLRFAGAAESDFERVRRRLLG